MSELRSKKGIKVKELARELGMTSRRLIELCRANGLPVQNSITRISRIDDSRVRAWAKQKTEQDAAQ